MKNIKSFKDFDNNISESTKKEESKKEESKKEEPKKEEPKKESSPKSKYNKEDKVLYIPKLSGLDPKKPLIIKYKHWKETDELSTMLKVKFKPEWYYSFDGTNLTSAESDLKPYKK